LGLSDIYAVQGFYRMGKENLLNFSKGAEINTDDGAQLEFSAPKSLRRATTELNRKIMVPYIVDSPPWLKNKPPAVPEAMHHYYMAQSYVASVANNRALKELEQAVRLDPTNPKFYVLQTKVLLDQDKSAEAAKTAFAAMERSRDTIPEILALSDEFYLPEAKTVYSKAISMGSREVLPYLGLGNIALHSGDVVEAEKWFVPARELQADHPAVLLAFGRLALAKGNREKDEQAAINLFQEAKTLLEKSKGKGEDSATLYSELAEVYRKLNLWDSAAESYKEALRMRRRRNDWRRSLGEAYAKLGKVREAEQKYREVLALSPDDEQALYGLQALGKRY
jgi:tetratricopeptide (TPR) repeat protein